MDAFPIVRRLLDLPPQWQDRTVFRSRNGNLSFGQLRIGMLRMAAWFSRNAGVQKGDRVATCLPKSLEAVQAIYAVLCAGAVYVPLEFRGPPARLAAILRSVRPRLLLTTAEMSTRLGAQDGLASSLPITAIEPGDDGRGLDLLLGSTDAATAIPSVDADDLSSIFFTSGSTGEPKGVMLSHRSMAATLDRVQRTRQHGPHDRLLNQAALHYVASFELLFPIVSGCSVFLVPEAETMFPDRVGEHIEREQVTHLLLTATSLRLLFEGGGLGQRQLQKLRRIEFFGEPMPVPTLRRIMAILPNTEFVNIYGATEAYDMANFAVPRPFPETMPTMPLGKPSPMYELTLRGDKGLEVPQGEVGEICVVGPQVMTGYWDDPELTAARRINGQADSYRTGDQAFFDEAGLLRLVGRKDQMVKLRGHRIDLGEIEAALKTHPAVVDALVLVAPSAEQDAHIHALVLADERESLAGDLKRLCIERLPRFAQPARIAVLQQFPMLSTGKIDRQALKALVGKKI